MRFRTSDLPPGTSPPSKLDLGPLEVHSKGQTVGQVSKQIGVTEQTYYWWRKEYGGLKVDQAKYNL